MLAELLAGLVEGVFGEAPGWVVLVALVGVIAVMFGGQWAGWWSLQGLFTLPAR